MKRKRFVKKLMAVGFDRNRANALAELCVLSKTPYSQFYNRKLPLYMAGEAARRAGAAFKRVSVAICRLAEAANKLGTNGWCGNDKR